MDCGYFADLIPQQCQQPYIVPGVNRTLTVLNESALLALESGEVQIGDEVIVIAAIPGVSQAYGVFKFVNPLGTGLGQFALVGNPVSVLTPADFVAFVNSLPPAPPPGGGAWNNGGSPTVS